MHEQSDAWTLTLARSEPQVEEILKTVASRMGLQLEWTIGRRLILSCPFSLASVFERRSGFRLVGDLVALGADGTSLRLFARPGRWGRALSERSVLRIVNMIHEANAEL